VISMTTQKEQEREDARRLASFDEQDDGADDWHMNAAGDPGWGPGPLFVPVLARALNEAFKPAPGTPR
ncbi:MAG: hypothetical protein WB500_11485, partial [Rhodoplanes sp.]